MIAMLSGLLHSVAEDSLIIDVNGVGYHVFVSGKTISGLPPVGAPLKLNIETNVREDHIHLYGFSSVSEQQWFGLLTSVQGVGAKVGLAILSVHEPEDLAMAISAQDAKAVARANGVGPKLAGRIVNELADKAGTLAFHTEVNANAPSAKAAAAPAGPAQDAVSALINLGYDRAEAFKAVRSVADDNSDLQSLITAALKELAQ